MKIYCCACEQDVRPKLTNGLDVYPHMPELFEVPFWKCEDCGNFVGCHHKTANPTRPLGCIATTEINKGRRQIHLVFDPIWQSGDITRQSLYSYLSQKTGRKYHTANLRSMDEVREVLAILRDFRGVT